MKPSYLSFPPAFDLTDDDDEEDIKTPDIGDTEGRGWRIKGDGENLG